jgi:hypothetical protein
MKPHGFDYDKMAATFHMALTHLHYVPNAERCYIRQQDPVASELLRDLSKDYGFTSMTGYNTTVGTVINIYAMPMYGQPPTPNNILVKACEAVHAGQSTIDTMAQTLPLCGAMLNMYTQGGGSAWGWDWQLKDEPDGRAVLSKKAKNVNESVFFYFANQALMDHFDPITDWDIAPYVSKTDDSPLSITKITIPDSPQIREVLSLEKDDLVNIQRLCLSVPPGDAPGLGYKFLF